jgi:hypothetical protein
VLIWRKHGAAESRAISIYHRPGLLKTTAFGSYKHAEFMQSSSVTIHYEERETIIYEEETAAE